MKVVDKLNNFRLYSIKDENILWGNNMNLIQIEYFVEVAKQLSFTNAANNLHVSQPALSKQISVLEKELGVSLLDRNNRNVKLTVSGKVLLDECENLQLQVEKMVRKVQSVEMNRVGTINVGCLKSIDDEFFEKIISNFKKNYPECNIVITKFDFKELREGLENNEFDIIFTLSFELKLLSNVLYKVIQFKDGCFVVSKNHPLAEKEKLTFEDLGDTPFLVIDEKFSAGAQLLYDKWKANNYTPAKIIIAPNIETLLSYVKLGMGVAIFDDSILKSLKDSVKTFEVPNNKRTFSNVAAWKKSNLNPILTYLLGVIKDVRGNQL